MPLTKTTSAAAIVTTMQRSFIGILSDGEIPHLSRKVCPIFLENLLISACNFDPQGRCESGPAMPVSAISLPQVRRAPCLIDTSSALHRHDFSAVAIAVAIG